MRFDITLKDLLQSTPDELFHLLTGAHPVEFLTVELPSAGLRKPDFLARLSDGRLHHLELLSRNDAEIDARMFEYCALLYRLYREVPYQQALYLGEQPIHLDNKIEAPWGTYAFQAIDIREFEAERLFASNSLADNLLSVLCGTADPSGLLARISARIRRLPEKRAADAWSKLLVLSELRRLQTQTETERLMPIDLMEISITRDMYLKGEREGLERGVQQGVQQGESHLLRIQLERRFGNLPDWAMERITQANSATLESWALRLLDATSLKDVLAP